jgi:hypothetical protein
VWIELLKFRGGCCGGREGSSPEEDRGDEEGIASSEEADEERVSGVEEEVELDTEKGRDDREDRGEVGEPLGGGRGRNGGGEGSESGVDDRIDEERSQEPAKEILQRRGKGSECGEMWRRRDDLEGDPEVEVLEGLIGEEDPIGLGVVGGERGGWVNEGSMVPELMAIEHMDWLRNDVERSQEQGTEEGSGEDLRSSGLW